MPTVSTADINDPNIKASIGLEISTSIKPIKPTAYIRYPITKVDAIVPNTANNEIVQKFAKKSFFFSEYPASN
jgi:hypothetical protein